MIKKKSVYVSPQIEVIRMEVEGVIASSGSLPQIGEGGSAYRSGNARSSATRSYNGTSSSELEDLINDILTVEQ